MIIWIDGVDHIPTVHKDGTMWIRYKGKMIHVRITDAEMPEKAKVSK